MSDPPIPRRMHVERTPDPAVLQWITHDGRLRATTPGPRRAPPDSPAGALVAAGAIVAIAVRGDAIVVRRAVDVDWAEAAGAVQTALLRELEGLDGSPSHWLLEPAVDAPVAPTRAQVQRIVDRAAGPVLAAHGGAMTVTAVDPTSVRLRADRACTGCVQAPHTLESAAQAIRATYPQIVDVVLDTGATRSSRPSGVAPPPARWRPRLRRRGSSGCH